MTSKVAKLSDELQELKNVENSLESARDNIISNSLDF